MDTDLKIWKELAIEKQILMKTVTEGLGLPEDASEEEIRAGILAGVEQIKSTEATISALRAEHASATTEIEQKLESERKSRELADQHVLELKQTVEKLEATLDATSKSNQAEVAQLKSQVDAKNKELKNINNLLGDSPANMAKKMKSLNKKKFDESEARKRAEAELKNVQKELRESKKEIETQKARLDELEAASADDNVSEETQAA